MDEETLLQDALAKPAAERTAFLDEACAGKPEVRAAVETLLATHEATGGFASHRRAISGRPLIRTHRRARHRHL